ncbi:FERM domain-containing protein 4B isoform X3 [Oryzias latipes]|uniref:FERM domain-containing protein 4B isoform X3 n=1 Tax=Oryzias latipes TaxID=8090 RepID=UPI0005CB812F|nr:FERM domain-containing protein 4B isoform X3 [Oryzias latipes]
MEVKGHFISAPEILTCRDRKNRERMAELQERRRGLQALLGTRLAELRHICLQEAELTGTVPCDFPLEVGEKPPCVQRRGGNRKSRVEEENTQRSKQRKKIFSGTLRKHNTSEHNHTNTHNSKRTVHRGCHTDDTVRSESSSTPDSAGHEHGNDNATAQSHPLVVSSGSPAEIFYQNKTSRNLLNRADTLQTHKPPSNPPTGSQDSTSSTPSVGGEGSNGLVGSITPPQEELAAQHIGAMSRQMSAGGTFWSPEMLTDRHVRTISEEEKGTAAGKRREGAYGEILLDYVCGRQRQLQRQFSQPNKKPITVQHQLLRNGDSVHQLPGAPPICYRHLGGKQERSTVTRTKSCGHNSTPPTIQPDPHPNLLPPRPPQLASNQDSQLEEATRSLHKALALEGLRDWYLRNTLGSSHHNQASSKVTAGAGTKTKAKVKGQNGGGEALQRRRTTHAVLPQSTYETDGGYQHAALHPKPTLSHSVTFHGHPLHSRTSAGTFCHDLFSAQKQEAPSHLISDQLSPGTLV